MRDALVPIAGTTRRTVAVADTASGEATRFDEPGPAVSSAEWAALLTAYDALLPRARAVALCGSLPPGVHVGAYAALWCAAPARPASRCSSTPAGNPCAAASPPAPTS